MRSAAFSFFSACLLIVASGTPAQDDLPVPPEPQNFTQYYQFLMNYHVQNPAKNGEETTKSPILNASAIEQLNVNVTGKNGTFTFLLSNVTINGLSDIAEDKLKIYSGQQYFAVPGQAFDLNNTIPTIQLHADYHLNGTQEDQHLNCTGDLHVFFDDASTGGKIFVAPAKPNSNETAQNTKGPITHCDESMFTDLGIFAETFFAAVHQSVKSLNPKLLQNLAYG